MAKSNQLREDGLPPTVAEEMAVTSPSGAALALAEKYGIKDSGIVDSSAITPPFLSIAQGLSPELNPSEAGYIPNLKLGQFFVKGRVLGDTLNVVVCYGTQEYVEWSPARKFVEKYPITSTRIHECVKGQGKDQYKDFTPEGNQLVKTYNLFLLVEESPDVWLPVILAAKSTLYRAAAELHNAVGFPAFAKNVRLRTVGKSNEQGSWFIFGHQIMDGTPADNVMDMAAEVAKLAASGAATSNHADSAYSSSAYDNTSAVDQNTVDAAAEAMK